ncbi:hypothetical protein BPJM79_30420 [Bacillus pumilus]
MRSAGWFIRCLPPLLAIKNGSNIKQGNRGDEIDIAAIEGARRRVAALKG